jgi:hypothetical protein
MSGRLFVTSVGLNVWLSVLLFVGWVGPNQQTSFNPTIDRPLMASTSTVHPLASVNGSVQLSDRVFVAPFDSIRDDEAQDIHIGNDSNVQDGVVIHGLETFENGRELIENQVEVDGHKYSVHIGERVSLAISPKCTGRHVSGTTPLSACRHWSSGQKSFRMWW